MTCFKSCNDPCGDGGNMFGYTRWNQVCASYRMLKGLEEAFKYILQTFQSSFLLHYQCNRST